MTAGSGGSAADGESRTPDSRHVRRPRQERSRRTLRRIAEATRELLEKRPFDDLTVDEIVDRAGSSKGAFYARFPDKRSLLRFLSEEEFEAVLAGWSRYLDPERWADVPLEAFIEDLVGRLIRIYRERGTEMRAFIREARFGEDEEVRRKAVRLNRHVHALVREVVERSEEQVGHPDPGRAAGLGLLAVGAAARDAILFAEEGTNPAAASDGELRRELTRMYLAYLGAGDLG